MQTFLTRVANRLKDAFGNDMRRVIVVFPNKRIGLFLNRAIAKAHGGRPVLAPQYTTIDELFESYSDKRLADPVTTVCMAYQAYCDARLSFTMPLDDFYGWGEILVRDFNEIDQQLVDADRLFQNAKDLEEIDFRFFPDTFDAKTEAVLDRFGGTPHAKNQLRRWMDLWTKMPSLYHRLNELLAAAKDFPLAYKGALQREVIESGKVRPKEGYTYVFVGFKVLTETEKALMDALRDVSLFISDDEEEGDNRPEISVIQASTDIQQAEYVHTWIDTNMRNGRITSDRLTHTAVVLADEGLLLPVISSLPPVETNITMGYPLAQTPLLPFINTLREEFNRTSPDGTAEDYLQYVIQAVRQRMQEGPADRNAPWFHHLMDEALAQALFETDKLLQNIRTGLLGSITGLSLPLVQRILIRMLAAHSIAFHGEPAKGLQVMGVLETRSLDFDNLLILSANEGVLPKNERAKSMIPYIIRKHFHLADEEKQVAIYANNFFRLFRRARHIDIVYSLYNASGEAEESRFIRRLLAETGWDVTFSRLAPPAAATEDRERTAVPKTEETVRAMMARPLSPSALNTYINCPRSYWYSHVKGLRKDETLTADLQSDQIGTLFHKAAECFYRPYMDKQTPVTAQVLEHAMASGEAERAMDKAFEEVIYSKNPQLKSDPGFLLVIRSVLGEMMARLIELDKAVTPFTVFALEERCYTTLSVNGQPLSVGGYIDRIDHLLDSGTLRIMDYKTGSKEKTGKTAYASLDELCSIDCYKPAAHYQVQLLLYAYVLQRKYPGRTILPALCFPLSGREPDYQPRVRYVNADGALDTILSYNDVRETFEARFEAFLRDEMFNPDRPFESPWDTSRGRDASFYDKPDTTRCHYCDFRSLCGLGKPKEF